MLRLELLNRLLFLPLYLRSFFFKSILLTLLVLSGCKGNYLKVRSQYLTPLDLASFSVRTPDPYKECYYGQQIVVEYRTCGDGDLCLVLDLRFGDGTHGRVEKSVRGGHGHFTYRLLNEEYWDKGGISFFKVDLYQGGALLESWRHHVWVENI